MRITFLGTGGSWPTKRRGSISIGLTSGPSTILLDCGEGTQREILSSPISPMKIRAVLITHLHGDHILGLPGMVQSMSLNGRTEPLTIIGPEGTHDSWLHAMSMCHFSSGFDILVREMEPGSATYIGEMKVKAFNVSHNVRTIGYRIDEPLKRGRFGRDKALDMGIPEGPLWGKLQRGEDISFEKEGRVVEVSSEDIMGPPRKGLSLVYSGDTSPCNELLEASRGADVLIHEATYTDELRELADQYGHSTAKGACELALKAGVNNVFLIHTSPRYSKEEELERLKEEAMSVCPDVIIPEDGETYEVGTSGKPVIL